MKILFVVPTYEPDSKAVPLYYRALESINRQVSDGVEVCSVAIVDDGWPRLQTIPKIQTKHITLAQSSRRYAACSICHGIKTATKVFEIGDNDVIAILDGDDQLFGRSVVQILKRAYKGNCALTYGSFCKLSRTDDKLYYGPYKTYLPVREQRWKASHLKTFRYWLWKKLPESVFRMRGVWLKTTSDVAMMFPLIEMAGWDRIKYIDKCLYVYNDQSPLNDHKVAAAEQKDVEIWLRQQMPFQRVEA